MKYVRQIQLKDLSLGNKIGDGGFGKVYRGTWQVEGQREEREVAVKILKKGIVDLPIFMGDFLREASTWSKLDHPNVAKFLGICWRTPSPYIVVGYVNGG